MGFYAFIDLLKPPQLIGQHACRVWNHFASFDESRGGVVPVGLAPAQRRGRSGAQAVDPRPAR